MLEMLDGAEDCKWIYLALIRLARAHRELSGRWPEEGGGGGVGGQKRVDEEGEGQERVDEEGEGQARVREWVAVLGRLDPIRKGRWEDMRVGL